MKKHPIPLIWEDQRKLYGFKRKENTMNKISKNPRHRFDADIVVEQTPTQHEESAGTFTNGRRQCHWHYIPTTAKYEKRQQSYQCRPPSSTCRRIFLSGCVVLPVIMTMVCQIPLAMKNCTFSTCFVPVIQREANYLQIAETYRSPSILKQTNFKEN